MDKIIQEYEIYLKEQELAVGTIDIYLRYAKQTEEYIQLTGTTKTAILGFKNNLRNSNLAPATFNLAIISINKYLRYRGFPECTVKTEKLQKSKSLDNVISIEEYQAMLQAARNSNREKYYHIMKTLAQTGIRVSELKYFTVERLKMKKIHITNKGKIREIYLPDTLICGLQKYCHDNSIESGVIFRGNTEKAIGRNSVYKMLIRIGTEIGISKAKLYPHSFRHLFAITYINCYGNLAELADILGHSNLETTRIYTVSTAEEKRKRMERLGL